MDQVIKCDVCASFSTDCKKAGCPYIINSNPPDNKPPDATLTLSPERVDEIIDAVMKEGPWTMTDKTPPPICTDSYQNSNQRDEKSAPTHETVAFWLNNYDSHKAYDSKSFRYTIVKDGEYFIKFAGVSGYIKGSLTAGDYLEAVERIQRVGPKVGT